MQIRDKDYKNIADTYNELGEDYLKKIADIKVELFDEFLETVPEGGKILDVGCAGGRDSKRFIDKDFSVIGIDIVEDFIDYCKKDIPNAVFLLMDMTNLEFPKESFDAIWCNAVLHHLKKKDVKKVLDNFHRILKKSGTVYIRVKMGEGTKKVTDKNSPEKERMFSFFTEKELKEYLESSNFRIERFLIADDPKGRELNWLVAIAYKV